MERDAKKQQLIRRQDNTWEEIPQVIFSITSVVPGVGITGPSTHENLYNLFYIYFRINNVLTRNNHNFDIIHYTVWKLWRLCLLNKEKCELITAK